MSWRRRCRRDSEYTIASLTVGTRSVLRTPYIKERLDKLGDALVTAFHMIALFLIGAAILWSAGTAYLRVIRAGYAGLEDILLLFIYLELGTIVGVYFKTDRLPVLFLFYVAITALTRFLAVDIKYLSLQRVLGVTGAIFVLTLAVLVLQIAISRFGTPNEEKRRHSQWAGLPPW